MSIFAAASLGLLVSMFLILIRAIRGPSVYDRALAGNAFGTTTILMIGAVGFLTGRPDFLDVAILYALLNFTGTIAIVKYFRYKTMTPHMGDDRAAHWPAPASDSTKRPL